MDIYTTAFTYPRRIRQVPSSKSLDVHGSGFGANGATAPEAETVTSPSDAEAIQNMAMSIMTSTGCHVSYALADQGRGWNFLVSGAYQQVMLGRGTIMRECPTKVSRIIILSLIKHLMPYTDVSLHQSPSIRDPGFACWQAHYQGGCSPTSR
jgi:hypothetical protein